MCVIDILKPYPKMYMYVIKMYMYVITLSDAVTNLPDTPSVLLDTNIFVVICFVEPYPNIDS